MCVLCVCVGERERERGEREREREREREEREMRERGESITKCKHVFILETFYSIFFRPLRALSRPAWSA